MVEVRNFKLPHRPLHHGIVPILQTFLEICNPSCQQLLSQEVDNCWGRWRHRNGDTALSMYWACERLVFCSSADSQPYLQSLATSHCQAASQRSTSCITRGLDQTRKVYSHCWQQIGELSTALYIIYKWHTMKQSLSRPQNIYPLAALLDQTRLLSGFSQRLH